MKYCCTMVNEVLLYYGCTMVNEYCCTMVNELLLYHGCTMVNEVLLYHDK